MALSRIGNERNQLTEATFASNSGTIYDQCNLHYDQTLEELVRMHSWNCCKKRIQIGSYKVQIVNGSDTSIGTVTLEATSTSASGRPIFDSVAPNTVITASTNGYIKLEFDEDNGTRWKLTRRYSGGTNTHYVTSTVYAPDLTFESNNTIGTVTIVAPNFEYDYSYRVPSDAIRSFYLTNEATAYKFLKPRVDWYMEGKQILTNYEKAYLCFEGKPEPTDMDSLFAQAFICFLAYKLAIPLEGDRQLAAELLKEFYEFALPEARRVNGMERLATPEVDSEWLEATITSNSAYSNSYPPFSQTSYGSFE